MFRPSNTPGCHSDKRKILEEAVRAGAIFEFFDERALNLAHRNPRRRISFGNG
jgi:hypothetical protein